MGKDEAQDSGGLEHDAWPEELERQRRERASYVRWPHYPGARFVPWFECAPHPGDTDQPEGDRGLCEYCGAELEARATECPRCGGPRDGRSR